MSDAQWYVMTNGERTGPISQVDLLSRAEAGLLNRDELVWRDGFTEWVSAGTIKGLFRAPPPAPHAEARRSWWKWLFRAPSHEPNARKVAPAPLAKSKPANRGSKIDRAANRKMIAQLRDDAADSQLLVAEMIRVTVRLNPVNRQIRDFIEYVDPITEHTPRHEKAQIVQTAMQSVDVASAVLELNESLDLVTEIAPEMLRRHAADLLKVWPKSRQFIRHRWLDDSFKAGDDIRQQMQGQRTLSRDFTVI